MVLKCTPHYLKRFAGWGFNDLFATNAASIPFKKIPTHTY